MSEEMRFHSVFDIIGPVMVGPSSSHTAGAARIGHVVRDIFGEEPARVDIYLYESFAKTYRGHGTDIALVGGLLGMGPDDPHLPESLKIASERGIKVTFIPKSDQVTHPNTAKLVLQKGAHTLSVMGVSIGGGNIQISEIDGFKLSLTMGTPTFVTIHQDVAGVVAEVSKVLSDAGANIGTLTLTRQAKGDKAIMVVESDDRHPELVPVISALPHIDHVTYFG